MTDKQIQFDGINIHRKGDTLSYGVAILQGNTRPSLFKKEDNKITSIASFSNSKNAAEFTKFLERLATDVNRTASSPSDNRLGKSIGS